MNFYLSLPITFLAFFFFELPAAIMHYFISLNRAAMQLLSLPLLFRTYFKPWKNEYRGNFIPVAIGIGITIKTVVIFVELLFLLIFLLCETGFILFIIMWPILTIFLLLL